MTLSDKLAAIRAGLDGVTPGPWETDPECENMNIIAVDGYMVADCAIFGFGEIEIARSEEVCGRNAQYLARLDPQTVAEILDRYERMEKALNKAIYLIDAMMTNDPNEPVSDAGHVVSDLWAHDFEKIREALGGNDD